MHELGIMTSVLDAAKESAREAGATRLLKVSMSVGEMTEAIEDALVFAFEALTENDPFTEGAELSITMVTPIPPSSRMGMRMHIVCKDCTQDCTL